MPFVIMLAEVGAKWAARAACQEPRFRGDDKGKGCQSLDPPPRASDFYGTHDGLEL